jgi:uncharacterized membrane protein
MRHDYRILHDMLVAGKIDTNEFKERIDAIKSDTYMNLSEKFMQGEISEDEFVERYNRLVEQEAEKHWEPVEPHEHI